MPIREFLLDTSAHKPPLETLEGIAPGEAVRAPAEGLHSIAAILARMDYTVHDALIHIAQHNSHHLGQIITTRQLLRSWPPPSGSLTW